MSFFCYQTSYLYVVCPKAFNLMINGTNLGTGHGATIQLTRVRIAPRRKVVGKISAAPSVAADIKALYRKDEKQTAPDIGLG